LADFQNSFTAQSVCQPTHDDGNVLDSLITAEHSELLGNIDVHNPGCSDHKLVTAELDVGRPSACHRQFTYRNVKVVDPVTFAARLNAKSVCTAPADDVNTFADQLDRDITDVLDQLAPSPTRVKRCGKRINRWLPDDAVAAKRLRRKLERRWGERSSILIESPTGKHAGLQTLSSPSHDSLITNSDCKKEPATRV